MIAKAELQEVIHHDIPLTQAMGLQVKTVTSESITLIAPLENNVNHKSTAFGGSLFSMAVLSGWCLLYFRLKELDVAGNIVIQESDIKYLQPVTGEIEASCQIDSEQQFNRFIKIFKRKGLARIKLKAEIKTEDGIAVEFNGSYVVHS